MRLPNPDEPRRSSISRLFHPILAGATLRDRLLACLGALVSIALTGLLCGALFGEGSHLPLIVAPMLRLNCHCYVITSIALCYNVCNSRTQQHFRKN